MNKKNQKQEKANSISSNKRVLVPDSEDCELNDIDIIMKQKKQFKKTKKKKKRFNNNSNTNNNNNIVTVTQIPNDKKNQIKDEEKDFIEFILGDFHSFHTLADLKTFKNMTSLSLVNESINSISNVITNLPNKDVLKYLNLNENEISNLSGIEQLTNIEEIYLNFNQISKLTPNLLLLQKLKKLWICENKIEMIENIPITIKNLWLANNNIKEIPENFEKYENLEFFNISGNFISDLKDMYILKKLPKLKKLYLVDINFGENPVNQLSNYRQIVLHSFKENLECLDQMMITPEEIKNVENLYVKKNNFYQDKIRNNHKITKNIFHLMKTHKLFITNMKYYKIKFYSQRLNMLKFLKYEKNYLNSLNDIFFEDISKEITDTENNINNCLNVCEKINDIYHKLKMYLSNLNDLFIVINFYELESFGNFKIEPGNSNLKWTKSCMDLMKSRISKNILEEFQYENVLYNEIYKITNKQTKYLFNSLYENLVEMNNKFGNEQKYFDFLFLILPKEILTDTKSLFYYFFGKQQNKNVKEFNNYIFLCDNFSYLDKFELKVNKEKKNSENNESISENEENINTLCENDFSCIICKCALFEEMIDEIKIYSQNLFNNLDEIKNYIEQKSKNSTKDIIRLKINEETNFYYYKIQGVIEPEYFVRYTYEKNSGNNDNNDINENENENNWFVSSFKNKINMSNDYENIFNSCAQFLYNTVLKVKPFYPKEELNKYSQIKFDDYVEMENNLLFFAKNSVISFLYNCFKYFSDKNNFFQSLEQINEKIKEISNVKFDTNFLIELNKFISTTENQKHIRWANLKEISLYNMNLTSTMLDELLNKIKNESVNNNDILNMTKNVIYISLSKNKLEKIDMSLILDIFPNLLKIDLSQNNIYSVLYNNTNVDNKYSLSSVDISYNNITDFENLVVFLKNFENLTEFILIANPFQKKFQQFNENIDFKIDDGQKEQMIKEYEDFKNVSGEIQKTVTINNENENKNKINNSNKFFNYIYDCFSFSNKYSCFGDNIYFVEKINNENNISTVILSKKKLYTIPKINSTCDIQILYLNLNKITKISNMSQFTVLSELYMQNNKIKKIENLPETLKKLDISNNDLNELTGIEIAKNIIYFNFENNNIRNISQLFKLTNLIELYCAGNYIKNPKDCYQLGKVLSKLEILDITGNEVCRNTKDFRLYMIHYCNNLKNLNRRFIEDAEKNNVKEYFNGKLTSELLEKKLGKNYNLFNLLDINLSNLKLKDEINLFNKDIYPKLRKINLSKNVFKNFNIFGNMPNLLELNLNNNTFTEIFPKKTKLIEGKGILGLSNLESLEIAGNQLTDINGIHLFKKLKILILRENNLTKIDSITHLERLKFLDVSFNKLRTLDRGSVGFLPSLQIFLCDNNYLKNINCFEKYTAIQNLSFDNNKIPDFYSIEKLSALENLKDLSLNNNPINKTLNYRNAVIRMFTKIIKLDGREISEEEKELRINDSIENNNNTMQLDDIGFYYYENLTQNNLNYYDPFEFQNNKKLTSANYNFKNQRLQEKSLKNLNCIRLGGLLPSNLPSMIIQRGNKSESPINIIPISRKYINNSRKENNNFLPQIKSYNYGHNTPTPTETNKKPKTNNNIINNVKSKKMIFDYNRFLNVNNNKIILPLNKNRRIDILPANKKSNV